jgi:hypothetical protein
LKPLEKRSTYVNAVNEPSSEGTVPVKELTERSKNVKVVKEPSANQHSPFETIGIK